MRNRKTFLLALAVSAMAFLAGRSAGFPLFQGPGGLDAAGDAHKVLGRFVGEFTASAAMWGAAGEKD